MARRLGIVVFITLLILGGQTSAQEPPNIAKEVDRLSQDLNDLRQSLTADQQYRQGRVAKRRDRGREFRARFETLRGDVDRLKDAVAHQEKINAIGMESISTWMSLQDDRIDGFLGWAGWVGVMITALLAVIGGYTFFYTPRQAEAKAEEAIGTWLLSNEEKLDRQFEGFSLQIDEKVKKATDEIDGHVKEAKNAIGEIDGHEKEARKRVEIIKEIQENIMINSENINHETHSAEDWWPIEEIARGQDELEIAANFFHDTSKKEGVPDVEIARSFNNKAVELWEHDKLEEELQVYEQVISRFGNNKQADLQDQVARALVYKATTLEKQNKPDEELKTYEEIISRYGDAEEAALRERVSHAHTGIGVTSLIEAKSKWVGKKSSKDTRKILSSALTSFDEALSYSPENPIDLGNRGYIKFLLGDREGAEVDLRKALKLGGEKIRDSELEDADIHPVPLDEEFKAMVHRLWDEVSAAKE